MPTPTSCQLPLQLFAAATIVAATAAQTPVDACNLVFPASTSTTFGSPSPSIYAQVFKASVTEPNGPAAGMTAALGYGPDGSDPAASQLWQWFPATYNVQIGNNDEYVAVLPAPIPGTWDYAFRFAHNGSAFRYADLDGSGNGYSPQQSGSLVVFGSGSPVDFCALQFPPGLVLQAGTTSPSVYAQVYKQGVTEAAGPALGIQAQLGIGPDGTDPATSPAWQWIAASYNLQVGNNDEYAATFTTPLPGNYDYAFRFAYANSAFTYADLDGSGNGYAPSQSGALTSLGTPATIPSLCAGPTLALTVSGAATLGGVLTSTVTGLGGGLPYHTWDFGPIVQPLLPFCLCWGTANGWTPGPGSTVVVPLIPGLIGVTGYAQGAEIVPPVSACNFPFPLNVTDVQAITIQ